MIDLVQNQNCYPIIEDYLINIDTNSEIPRRHRIQSQEESPPKIPKLDIVRFINELGLIPYLVCYYPGFENYWWVFFGQGVKGYIIKDINLIMKTVRTDKRMFTFEKLIREIEK